MRAVKPSTLLVLSFVPAPAAPVSKSQGASSVVSRPSVNTCPKVQGSRVELGSDEEEWDSDMPPLSPRTDDDTEGFSRDPHRPY